MSKAIPKTLVWVSLFCLFLISTACAPTLYKQPVANFQDATKTAKEVYFKELENTRHSFIVFEETKMNMRILSKPNYNYLLDVHIDQQKFIDELYSSKDIPSKSLEIRQRAFTVLEYYGNTLQTIASDDKTEALKVELTGFGSDTKAFLKAVADLHEISKAFAFLKPISDWAGPLASAIEVLNGIVDIISDYLREQALKKAILKADSMVEQLLDLFKGEAISALNVHRKHLSKSQEICLFTKANILASDKVGSGNKFIVHDLCSKIDQGVQQIPSRENVAEVFDLVKMSHKEMVKLAKGGDFDTLVERIRHFNQRIQYLKAKLDIISAN